MGMDKLAMMVKAKGVRIVQILSRFFPKENEDYIPGRSFDDAVLSFATAGAGVGVNVELNDAPAYYDGGLVKMTAKGEFYVMSSRNNDFSNRSHKATIIVE